jgi:hypothetical protein
VPQFSVRFGGPFAWHPRPARVAWGMLPERWLIKRE